jgi:hypothetical protein
MVGVLIFAISLFDLVLYNILINGQICKIVEFFKNLFPNSNEFLIKNIWLIFLFFFLPVCFFVGELFSDLSEIFIFDPIYNNARINKDDPSCLELLNPIRLKKRTYLFLLLCPLILKSKKCYQCDDLTISNQCDDLTIFFEKFNSFICSKGKSFSLSEMYFNMHRIMGGLLILFWILFIIHFILFCKTNNIISFIFFVINILLVYFCFEQGKKQRLFANRLIYFS